MKPNVFIMMVLISMLGLTACGKKAPLSPTLSQGGSEADYYKDSKKPAAQLTPSNDETPEINATQETADTELFPTLNKTITRSDEKKFPKPKIPKRDFILDPLMN